MSIYDRYARDVHRFALFLSGDAALAQDITAETFARAWAVRDQVRVGSVKAYLIMIARNLYRDARRKPAWTELAAAERIPERGPDPEASANARGELQVVMRALHCPNSIAPLC